MFFSFEGRNRGRVHLLFFLLNRFSDEGKFKYHVELVSTV